MIVGMRKIASKKMTTGLILVVVLATSLVVANMIIFSANVIARKSDDFLVRVENLGYRGDESETSEESMRLYDDRFATAATNTTKLGKAVVVGFDDGWASQYSNAKPILDKYGFKTTFFIVCTYVGNDNYMTWTQIKDLQRLGNDIQSHSMTHKDLTRLSAGELDFEVRESRQCLFEHGIDSNVFATPYNEGWHNPNVIDAISQYYDFAKNGNGPLTYLRCDGLPKTVSNQTDCRTYSNTDSAEKDLNLMNRYSIRAWSHNYYDEAYGHNDTKTFQAFIEEVNLPYKETSSDQYANSTSSFSAYAIPVLEYHKVDTTGSPTSTSPALFEAEMRYLHDNGFAVLTMNDFRYDEERNSLVLNYN